jgi:CPA1 family monovalent cation:H+ antiporter
VAQTPDVVILGLLVIVAVAAAVVHYMRIPYAVALVLAGLVLALLPDVPRVQLTPSVILTIFLPALLFYGAWLEHEHHVRERASRWLWGWAWHAHCPWGPGW